MWAVFLKIVSYFFLLLFVLGVVLMLLTWRKEKIRQAEVDSFRADCGVYGTCGLYNVVPESTGILELVAHLSGRAVWRIFLRPNGESEKVCTRNHDELHPALCHHVGRAFIPHAVFDDQHGSYSCDCAGPVCAQYWIKSGDEWPSRLEL